MICASEFSTELGDVESPPEKINNAPCLRMTGAHSWTFQGGSSYCGPWQEQTGCVWEQYLPTDDIIAPESEVQAEPGTKPQCTIKTYSKATPWSFSSANKFCCVIYLGFSSTRTFCLLPVGLAASLTHQDTDYTVLFPWRAKLQSPFIGILEAWKHGLKSPAWQCSESSVLHLIWPHARSLLQVVWSDRP